MLKLKDKKNRRIIRETLKEFYEFIFIFIELIVIKMLIPLFISIIWGFVPVIIKLYLHELPPEFILLSSSIIFFIGSFIYTYFFKYNQIIEGYNKSTYKIIIIVILTFLLASVISNLLYLKYLKKNNLNILSIIIGLAPAITVIAAYFLLNERLTLLQLFGTLFILIGLVFILYK